MEMYSDLKGDIRKKKKYGNRRDSSLLFGARVGYLRTIYRAGENTATSMVSATFAETGN